MTKNTISVGLFAIKPAAKSTKTDEPEFEVFHGDKLILGARPLQETISYVVMRLKLTKDDEADLAQMLNNQKTINIKQTTTTIFNQDEE